MIRPFLGFVLALAVSISVQGQPPTDNYAPFVRVDPAGPRAGAAGSGTVVGQKYVLTVAHVLGTETSKDIIWHNGWSTLGQVVARNDQWDIALLSFQTNYQIAYLQVSDSIQSGTVVMAGYPNSTPPLRYRYGRVTGGNGDWNWATGASIGGESGGAMLQQGKVAGLIRGTTWHPIYNPLGSETTLVPLYRVRTFLSQYCPDCLQAPTVPPNGGSPPPPTPIVPQPQPQPPPTPPTPEVPPPDYSRLEQEINELRRDLYTRTEGLRGPQGLPGPKGDPGPRGPVGPEAEVSEVHLEAVADILWSRMLSNPEPFQGEPGPVGRVDPKTLPPVVLQIRDGDEVFTQSAPLGEPIRIVVQDLIKK